MREGDRHHSLTKGGHHIERSVLQWDNFQQDYLEDDSSDTKEGWRRIPGDWPQFHDFIHGFGAGRGTGTSDLEAKLLQNLMATRKEVLYNIFLDLQKV